jgi:rhodanese-related sulfurtransferase
MTMRTKVPDPEKAKKYFLDKLSFTTGPAELKYLMDEGIPPHIIDVRAAEDYEEGHIPGAISLPEDSWRDGKLPSKTETNVIYCYSAVCHLAARAAHYFAAQSYPVVEMDGGMDQWREYGYPEEKGAPKAKVA